MCGEAKAQAAPRLVRWWFDLLFIAGSAKWRQASSVVLGLCLGASLGVLLTVTPVWAEVSTSGIGASVGKFAVNPAGAAVYEIPLNTAPGVKGIEPKLSLAYNSQAGNGPIGIGWALNGLSVLHRCGATLEIDGFKSGVHYDENDRFCLDGERLIYVGNNEYRTRRESYQRIVASDASWNPESFTVYQRDGVIRHYGTSPDSRIEAAAQAAVRVWALRSVEDRVGNWLSVSYAEENVHGHFRPVEIAYTGNRVLGQAPTNRVVFDYESRSDIMPGYEGGSPYATPYRLVAISSWTHELLARRYRLAYDNSGLGGRSRLTSVQECGTDGVCLAPTVFNWQTTSEADFHFSAPGSGSWSGHGGGINNNIVADFNGDGRADVAGYTGSNGVWHVSLSTGSDFNGPGSGGWNGHGGGVSNNIIGDFNGDGKSDIAGYAGNCQWHVSLSTGTDFNGAGSGLWPGHCAGVSNNLRGDFNGDGRTDIATRDRSNVTLCYSNGQGFECGQPVALRRFFNSETTERFWSAIQVGNFQCHDWDGDGADDPWYFPFYLRSDQVRDRFLRQVIGDANGDGKADYIGQINDYTGAPPTPVVRVAMSSGAHATWDSRTDSPFPPAQLWTGFVSSLENFFAGDFNGDGKTDLAAYVGSGQWDVRLSYGTEFYKLGSPHWPGHSGGAGANVLGDFNGDGKTDMASPVGNSGQWQVALSGGSAAVDKIVAVIDGLNATTHIEYRSSSDTAVYVPGNTAAYPYQDVQGHTMLVAKVTRSNGVAGNLTSQYRYGGMQVHHLAARSLGFRWVQEVDSLGRVTNTHYGQTLNGTEGQPQVIETYVGDVRVSYIHNTYTPVAVAGSGAQSSIDVRLIQRLEEKRDLSNVIIASSKTFYDYDAFGSVVKKLVRHADGHSTTTIANVEHDTHHWILGLVARRLVTDSPVGAPAQSRITAYEYVPGTGQLVREIVEPEDPALRVITTYVYDVFGNRLSTTIEGRDIEARTTTTAYDASGRFNIRTTNALDHSEYREFDPRSGAVTVHTGPNQLVTRWTYDGLGRRTTERRPDGTETRWEILANTAGGYIQKTTETGRGEIWEYFDQLGHPTRRAHQGLTGAWVYRDTLYYPDGRVSHVSHPFYLGEEPHWTQYFYDSLDRVTAVIEPGDRTTTTRYQGLSTIVTDAKNHSTTRVADLRGQIVEEINALGQRSTRRYGAFASLIEVVDPGGNNTTLHYDRRGRLSMRLDPNRGMQRLVYNVLGETVLRVDGSQPVGMSYDRLGRMVGRATQDGTEVWTYDSAPNGIGKLARVVGPSSARDYAYDAAGRVSSIATVIAGQTYVSVQTYDDAGRLANYAYPSGFTVHHVYDPFGHLVELQDASTGSRLAAVAAQDAHGRVTQEHYGNGIVSERRYNHWTGDLESIHARSADGRTIQDLAYTFDAMGNLELRRDTQSGTSESFGYDALNRLLSVSGAASKAFEYDAIGNLVNKSDVGRFEYSTDGRRPHAVARVAGLQFAYNSNGNLTRVSNEAGESLRTLEYTAQHQPKAVSDRGQHVKFFYAPDGQRVIKSGPQGTVHYLDGGYERHGSGTGVEHRHLLRLGNRIIALHVRRDAGASQTFYLHADHLGSVHVITDTAGKIVSQIDYDSHGKLTIADTGSGIASPRITDYGYTGHEHDHEIGLINMNARQYDPVLGQFLIPDPVIVPGQNPYAYANHNPLKYVDPTGTSSIDVFDLDDPWGSSLIGNWGAGGLSNFGQSTWGSSFGRDYGAGDRYSSYGTFGGAFQSGFILSNGLYSSIPSVDPYNPVYSLLPSSDPGYYGGAGIGHPLSVVDDATWKNESSSWVGTVADIGVGFTPASFLADVYAAITGRTYFGDTDLTWKERIFGLIPTVSEGLGIFRGGVKVAKALPTPTVSDPKLGNLVSDLYKGAKGPNPVGTGSTADAIRNELATGLPIHGTFHSQKGEQYMNALSNWLRKNPDASHHDRLVAESLKRDLQNALGRE